MWEFNIITADPSSSSTPCPYRSSSTPYLDPYRGTSTTYPTSTSSSATRSTSSSSTPQGQSTCWDWIAWELYLHPQCCAPRTPNQISSSGSPRESIEPYPDHSTTTQIGSSMPPRTYPAPSEWSPPTIAGCLSSPTTSPTSMSWDSLYHDDTNNPYLICCRI